jgi:hypothetical protein
MFEANSSFEPQTLKNESSTSPNNAMNNAKPNGFAALISVLHDWQPSDSLVLRRHLINELIIFLEERNYSCIRACIPAIIVDKHYPIDLMHFKFDQYVDEFTTRMLWMHQEFNSSIGIFLGVPNELILAEVEEAYEGLLITDDDCVIMLK